MAYSPTLGRWMQEDPKGYVDGANQHLAIGDSPVGLVDPLGVTAQAPPATQPQAPIQENPFLPYKPGGSQSSAVIDPADWMTEAGKGLPKPAPGEQMPSMPSELITALHAASGITENEGVEAGGSITCGMEDGKLVYRVWAPVRGTKLAANPTVNPNNSIPDEYRKSANFSLLGEYHTHPSVSVFSDPDVSRFIAKRDDGGLLFSILLDQLNNVCLLVATKDTKRGNYAKLKRNGPTLLRVENQVATDVNLEAHSETIKKNAEANNFGYYRAVNR